jgi:hypothetical protein
MGLPWQKPILLHLPGLPFKSTYPGIIWWDATFIKREMGVITMKRLLLIILVLALVCPVLADDDLNASRHYPSEEQLRGIIREAPVEPILPEPTQAVLADVSYTDFSQSLIDQVITAVKKIVFPEDMKKEPINVLVNSTPEEVLTQPQTVVAIGGINQALISQSSELNGKEVHAFCLRLGYGTSEWQQCEASLL